MNQAPTGNWREFKSMVSLQSQPSLFKDEQRCAVPQEINNDQVGVNTGCRITSPSSPFSTIRDSTMMSGASDAATEQ